MCMTTIATLNLASMLKDPLIQAVMRSDGVSQDDFAALMFRVKDQLTDRARLAPPARELADA